MPVGVVIGHNNGPAERSIRARFRAGRSGRISMSCSSGGSASGIAAETIIGSAEGMSADAGDPARVLSGAESGPSIIV